MKKQLSLFILLGSCALPVFGMCEQFQKDLQKEKEDWRLHFSTLSHCGNPTEGYTHNIEQARKRNDQKRASGLQKKIESYNEMRNDCGPGCANSIMCLLGTLNCPLNVVISPVTFLFQCCCLPCRTECGAAIEEAADNN